MTTDEVVRDGARAPAAALLTKEIRTLALVVVLGSIMTVLDSTTLVFNMHGRDSWANR